MEEIVKEGKISVITLLIRLFIVDIFACCILVGFIWFVKDIIIFFTTKLIITNKRISGKTGLINTNELADISGFSHGYVRDLECLTIDKTPTLEAIGKFADALEIDIRQLFDDVDINYEHKK